MSKMTRLLTPLLAAVAVTGCGGGKPETATVNGDVTVDGQPLKDGLVKFVAADGKANADAPIKDGKFTAAVPPGEMKVMISANKVVGKKKMYDTPDSPTADVVEEALPPRYNAQSELKLTVKSGSQNEKYDLKSK